MRRTLIVSIGVVVAGLIGGVVWLQYAHGSRGAAPATGPVMRVMRFVDPALVQHRSRFEFTFDEPAALTELRTGEHLDAVIAGEPTDLDRFRALTSWTRKQFEPGIPDPYPPLDARIILRDIRRGFTGGFCAQYNYVLAQSLMALGYRARYVTVLDHEVIEAWLPVERRWICLDPLYSATYVDEQGRPLSVLQIVERVRAGDAPAPGPGSLPEAQAAVARNFRRLSVWLRNDHVGRPINFTDIPRYKVTFRFDGDPEGRDLWTSLPEDLYPG